MGTRLCLSLLGAIHQHNAALLCTLLYHQRIPSYRLQFDKFHDLYQQQSEEEKEAFQFGLEKFRTPKAAEKETNRPQMRKRSTNQNILPNTNLIRLHSRQPEHNM